MNSGAHREAEWVLKPPSKRRQVITLDLYRLIQALSQDHLSVFFHPFPGYPGWDYNQDGHHERDGQSFSPPFFTA